MEKLPTLGLFCVISHLGFLRLGAQFQKRYGLENARVFVRKQTYGEEVVDEGIIEILGSKGTVQITRVEHMYQVVEPQTVPETGKTEYICTYDGRFLQEVETNSFEKAFVDLKVTEHNYITITAHLK